MKTYTKLLIIISCICFSTPSDAQIFKKIKKAAEETVEDETEKETKKTTKDAMKGIFGKKKKKKKNKSEQKSKNDNTNTQDSNSSSENDNIDNDKKIISGSEFFPNGQILFYERFERDKRGDFPVNWLTDIGGEIVLVDGEKALSIYDDAQAILDIDPLPENCAIEFDLITQNVHGRADLYVQLVSEKKFGNPSSGGYVVLKVFKKIGNTTIGVENWGKDVIKIDNNSSLSFWKYLERTTHITMVKNKNRFRFYLDNQKILDLPSFLGDDAGKYLRFKRDKMYGGDTQDVITAVANIKITEEAKDIRSQLLKGNLSTNKILFESGSSTIEVESEDILNTIGKVLEDNPDLQYLVIGHTDNVGDSQKNKTLSEQRAKAVIDYFIANFEISKSNLIPVGKGESEPVATNNTKDGKQQNRRVQFKKL